MGGVWEVYGRCVWEVCGRCMRGVWEVYGNCACIRLHAFVYGARLLYASYKRTSSGTLAGQLPLGSTDLPLEVTADIVLQPVPPERQDVVVGVRALAGVVIPIPACVSEQLPLMLAELVNGLIEPEQRGRVVRELGRVVDPAQSAGRALKPVRFAPLAFFGLLEEGGGELSVRVALTVSLEARRPVAAAVAWGGGREE